MNQQGARSSHAASHYTPAPAALPSGLHGQIVASEQPDQVWCPAEKGITRRHHHAGSGISDDSTMPKPIRRVMTPHVGRKSRPMRDHRKASRRGQERAVSGPARNPQQNSIAPAAIYRRANPTAPRTRSDCNPGHTDGPTRAPA